MKAKGQLFEGEEPESDEFASRFTVESPLVYVLVMVAIVVIV